MGYIDHGYYSNVFRGEPVDDTDFSSLLERAVEIVEEMCMYNVNECNLNKFSELTQQRIKKAVCAQIEYIDANGGGDIDNGQDMQSVSLGKFNYSKAGERSQPIYAPRALRILLPTGLLQRGGGCY